ncbi:hypothetical protein C8Q75DRAFT_491676 [Abortiporus biennis]|nr:hypothetical protein C8Q75DRAFT_491676 [Abortiporus biennis]
MRPQSEKELARQALYRRLVFSTSPAETKMTYDQLATLSDTGVLSSEVLLMVFTIYAEDTFPLIVNGALSPASLFTLTHVCKRWRFVALSCATLWGDIVISPHQSPLATLELLRLSKMVPLNLTLTRWTTNAEHNPLPTLLQHASRIKSITLELAEASALSNVQVSNLIATSSKLNKLNLVCSQPQIAELKWEATTETSLPRFHSLEALYLKNISLSTISPLASVAGPSIRHLSLTFSDVLVNMTVLRFHLVSTLSTMPSLESLNFETNYLGPRDVVGIELEEKVSLPCLKRVRLVDTLDGVTWVLSCLDCQSSLTTLSLTLNSPPLEDVPQTVIARELTELSSELESLLKTQDTTDGYLGSTGIDLRFLSHWNPVRSQGNRYLSIKADTGRANVSSKLLSGDGLEIQFPAFVNGRLLGCLFSAMNFSKLNPTLTISMPSGIWDTTTPDFMGIQSLVQNLPDGTLRKLRSWKYNHAQLLMMALVKDKLKAITSPNIIFPSDPIFAAFNIRMEDIYFHTNEAVLHVDMSDMKAIPPQVFVTAHALRFAENCQLIADNA